MPKQEPEQRLVSTWIASDIAGKLVQVAHENERSVSAELRLAIREHLAASQPLVTSEHSQATQ